jgi:O-antigen/teichoic acid export membrane protein
MTRRSQLRINIITSMGSTVLSTLVMAIAYPLYLHFLGYQQYGLWLVLTTVLTMAQVGNFGISPALIKLVAEDYAAGDIDGVYKYISSGLLSLLLSGTLLVCGVLLLRVPIIGLFGISGDNARVAYGLLPYVGLLSAYLLMADAVNSALAGLGRYDLVSYSQLGGQVITVGSAVALFKTGYGIWSLLIANALDAVFLTVVSLALIRQSTRSGFWFRLSWDRQRLRRILNFGSWVFGASIVNTVITPLNRLFITRFAGIAAVPVFDIAFVSCFKVRSLFESGFRSLAPEFSSLSVLNPGGAHQRVSATDRKGLRALYLGTPVYLAIFLFCGWGLKLWLRGRFTPELPDVFRIMLVGTYASMWGLQPWYALLGFGRSRHILISNIVQAVANISFVLLWPVVTHRSATLITVTLGTSAGLFFSMLYLRWQGKRLKFSLAAPAEAYTRFQPTPHPAAARTEHTPTNQSPQRV